MESAEQTQTKKENHFLRAMCAVFVICVVLVHYWPKIDICGYDLIGMIQAVGRFAMPVFFMISGYFLFSEDGHSEKCLKKKTIRFLILIIYMKLFFLIIDVLLAAFGFRSWDGMLYEFIVFGDATAHIWFIVVLFIIYLIHWAMYVKKIDFKWLLPISIALLVLDFVVCEIIPACGMYTIMGLKTGDVSAGTYTVIGFFFFQAGYYMHKYKGKLDEKFSNGMLIIIMILSFTLHMVETMWLLNTGIYDGTAAYGPNITIGIIIFSLSLFLATFRLKENQFRLRGLEWLGKNVMVWMYVYASLGSYPLKLTIWYHFEDNFMIYNVLGPIIAVIIDIVAALVMYWLLNQIFHKNGKKTAPSV